MTQVDFYVLELANQVEAQHNFACRIADKALSQGNNIFIATNSPEDSAQFDTTCGPFGPSLSSLIAWSTTTVPAMLLLS